MITNQPFFSICIPVYNGAKTLRETICSVLDQDFSNFEVCVVDNASTDSTPTILSEFTDSRLRVRRNPQLVPPHENWSLAIEMATGKWTKLICADDVLRPHALTKIAEQIKHHLGVQIICGSRDVIDEHGRQVRGLRRVARSGEIMNTQEFRRRILRVGSNPIGEGVCWTWDTTLTQRVGRFSSRWEYFIDLDYWLRLSVLSQVLLSNDHIGSFRISTSSWTSSLGTKAISESLSFFWTHEIMSNQKCLLKARGSLMAILRGLARALFLRRKLAS